MARSPLSRERILRAAIDLADRDGLDALTMRRLGQELGVEAMSLYNHVANKDAVLDGIVDVVLSEILVPGPGCDWRPAMRQRAASTREMLARHPWANGLIDSSVSPSPTRLRYAESILGCLREAGFSVEMAVHAFFMLDSYIYGFAIQEKSLPLQGESDPSAVADSYRDLPPESFPYLAETIVGYREGTSPGLSDEFEFGLELILDGLERVRSGFAT